VLGLKVLDYRNYEMLWECPVSKPKKEKMFFYQLVTHVVTTDRKPEPVKFKD